MRTSKTIDQKLLFERLNSLIAVQKYFSTEEACRKHIEFARWNGNPVCPHCAAENPYVLNDGKTYKCRNNQCYKKFSVTAHTIFDNTKIPLTKWFQAIYIASSHKKGISSHQLAKDIEVTQKTAWFMLSRIRLMLKVESSLLNGTVEIDETYIGGRSANKHGSKRKLDGTTGASGKAPAVGFLQRDGEVVVKVIEPDTAKGVTIKPLVRETVNKDATIITDGFGAYYGLNKEYKAHEVVRHEIGEFSRNGMHTNNIEGFWGGLKRGIYGIYHQVSPKHLHRYCDEFAFRYNTRKISEGERFNIALTQSVKRLKYKDLIK